MAVQGARQGDGLARVVVREMATDGRTAQCALPTDLQTEWHVVDSLNPASEKSSSRRCWEDAEGACAVVSFCGCRKQVPDWRRPWAVKRC